MEDNFDQNDFEEFLKEQVRNHRMYPSDTVWRDINKKLHGDKKWPGLTIAAFTLLSVTIAICVHFTPQPDIFKITPENTGVKNSTNRNSQHNVGLNNITPTTSLYKEKSGQRDQLSQMGVGALDVSRKNNNNKIPSARRTTDVVQTSDKREKNSLNVEKVVNNSIAESPVDSKIMANTASTASTGMEKSDVGTLPLRIIPPEIITSDKMKASGNQHNAHEYDDKNRVDMFLKDHKDDLPLYTKSKQSNLKNKFGFQIYIAPSVSYRKLLEDRSVLKEGNNNGPVGLNYVADVNNVVRHKPGNGLEAGISIMYNLSDKFRIKSGFQFNVRQYSIEAYRSSMELASIALVENNRIDTINTLAIYRNSNGFYPTELVNRYYQLAIPIGVEWEIIGNKTIQFNVAGSIQPTYLINRNAYLLSTNFKNYSENPEMVRSFNVNSNIEAFISFKAGYFKWQIGPQLRYQPYSTFIPQYPIKEHLMDYGVKIGISKTFK